MKNTPDAPDPLNPYLVSYDMTHRLANGFTYHSPQGSQQGRYEYLRNAAHHFALNIVKNTPPSREQSLAITALEEAVMWANASIARNE